MREQVCPPGQQKKQIEGASLAVADGVQFGVHAALSAASKASTSHLFDAHAGCCPVGLQIRRVGHHGLLFTTRISSRESRPYAEIDGSGP